MPLIMVITYLIQLQRANYTKLVPLKYKTTWSNEKTLKHQNVSQDIQPDTLLHPTCKACPIPKYPSSAPHENNVHTLSNHPPPTLIIEIPSPLSKPTVAPMKIGNDEFSNSQDHSNTPSPNPSFQPHIYK